MLLEQSSIPVTIKMVLGEEKGILTINWLTMKHLNRHKLLSILTEIIKSVKVQAWVGEFIPGTKRCKLDINTDVEKECETISPNYMLLSLMHLNPSLKCFQAIIYIFCTYIHLINPPICFFHFISCLQGIQQDKDALAKSKESQNVTYNANRIRQEWS